MSGLDVADGLPTGGAQVTLVCPLLTQSNKGRLPARIGETRIANHRTPRSFHFELPTKALLLFDIGGGLQRQHLERGDREAPDFILWALLGSGRARSTEDDNPCGQSCRSHNQDLSFHGSVFHSPSQVAIA